MEQYLVTAFSFIFGGGLGALVGAWLGIRRYQNIEIPRAYMEIQEMSWRTVEEKISLMQEEIHYLKNEISKLQNTLEQICNNIDRIEEAIHKNQNASLPVELMAAIRDLSQAAAEARKYKRRKD